MYYDFYSKFKQNGTTKIVPFIPIPIQPTDKTKIWNKKTDCVDNLSYMYYGHAYGGRIIMMANAELGLTEDDFPDQSSIRIPYPYPASVEQYIRGIKQFDSKYGI